MSTAVLEPVRLLEALRSDSSDYFCDWESPCGPVAAQARPRYARPAYTYRGHGDAHWYGQACHVVGATSPDERLIILACGCRARVMWWTLEPITSATVEAGA